MISACGREFEFVSFGLESTSTFGLRVPLIACGSAVPGTKTARGRTACRLSPGDSQSQPRGSHVHRSRRTCRSPAGTARGARAGHGQLLAGLHVLEHDRGPEGELALVRVLDWKTSTSCFLCGSGGARSARLAGSSHKSDMMMTRPRRFTARPVDGQCRRCSYRAGLIIESWCRSAFRWAGVLRGGTLGVYLVRESDEAGRSPSGAAAGRPRARGEHARVLELRSPCGRVRTSNPMRRARGTRAGWFLFVPADDEHPS